MRAESPARSALLAVCVLLLALLVLPGCGPKRGGWTDGWYQEEIQIKGPGGSRTVAMRYQLGDLSATWQEATTRPGDISFYNPDLRATIYSDSSCGSRYEDAPLQVLLNHLLFDFTDVETVEETQATLSGRASLLRISTAKLDGVPVQLAATITKNGPCVFDLVYMSPVESFAEGIADYNNFSSGLVVEYPQ